MIKVNIYDGRYTEVVVSIVKTEENHVTNVLVISEKKKTER